MRTIFSDPIGWSGSAVKTWPRLILMLTLYSCLVAIALFRAAEDGWRQSIIPLGVMIVMFQFLFLYALRRLYRELIRQGVDTCQ